MNHIYRRVQKKFFCKLQFGAADEQNGLISFYYDPQNLTFNRLKTAQIRPKPPKRELQAQECE